MNQTNTNRVTSHGFGAALAILTVWGLALAGVEPPAEVVVAITTIFTAVTQVVVRKFGKEG